MQTKYVLAQPDNIFSKPKNLSSIQTEVNEHMRNSIVDWLVENSSTKFHLETSTVFLAVQLLDILFSVITIRKNEIQIIACSCLLIASKFEEVVVSNLI